MNDASRLDAIATRWSLVRDAHLTGVPQNATAARQALVLRYAKSIRRYVGGMLKNSEDADELAQDVVMRLMKGDFGGADANRGRFRDLLKTAVRCHRCCYQFSVPRWTFIPKKPPEKWSRLPGLLSSQIND